VDGLVGRATGRAKALGENVDRHFVQRDRGEDLSLVGGQLCLERRYD
jgi:hypothetical protein